MLEDPFRIDVFEDRRWINEHHNEHDNEVLPQHSYRTVDNWTHKYHTSKRPNSIYGSLNKLANQPAIKVVKIYKLRLRFRLARVA